MDEDSNPVAEELCALREAVESMTSMVRDSLTIGENEVAAPQTKNWRNVVDGLEDIATAIVQLANAVDRIADAMTKA